MKLTPFTALLPEARMLSMEPERYQNARKTVTDILADGGYVQSPAAAYYVLEFRQADGSFSYGLSGLIDTAEYGGEQGEIRPHEATLKPREARQRERFLERRYLVKPILLTCPAFDDLQLTLQEMSSCREPMVCMPVESGVNVCVYPVSEAAAIQKLEGLLVRLPLPIAIADGHHRITTARQLGRELETSEDYAQFPAVLVPANSLSIDSYLRSVWAEGIAAEAILNKLAVFFRIEVVNEAAIPEKQGDWLLMNGKQLYALKVLEPTDVPDASWFDSNVLPVVFGIRDSTNDERLIATPAERGQVVLQQLAREQPEYWHFQPPPISMQTFFDYIAMGKIFPPKSTRFLPRVPSGLILKALDDKA